MDMTVELESLQRKIQELLWQKSELERQLNQVKQQTHSKTSSPIEKSFSDESPL